jgi:hypothetical protein
MREDGLTVRRSKRATKGVRCAFWKNERPLYEKVFYIHSNYFFSKKEKYSK